LRAGWMMMSCAVVTVVEAAAASTAGSANIIEPTIKDKTINFFIISSLIRFHAPV
jgi:hypothetical protein